MYWNRDILAGKRIIITGASSGIGKCCAIKCSELGAQIVAIGRDQRRLADTVDSLSGTGHLWIDCDLAVPEMVDQKLTILRATQPISGFIHCAGLERTNPLRGIDTGDFCSMFAVNVAAAVQIAKICTSVGYLDKLGSSIVLISSVSGLTGEQGKIEYSATKSAMYGMVKSMARELARKRVRVNCISPAMVDTPMLEKMFDNLPEESVTQIRDRHLLGILNPEDIANFCVLLLSGLSAKVTGAEFTLDSGYTLA